MKTNLAIMTVEGESEGLTDKNAMMLKSTYGVHGTFAKCLHQTDFPYFWVRDGRFPSKSQST
jgi:hypothetical protein